MKIKFEVDLEWLSEGQTIDSAVQAEIVREITNRINSKVIDDIQDLVKKEIEKKASDTVDKAYQELIEKRKIVITDGWGNNRKEYESVKQMIEEKFDNYLYSKVDKNGKPISGSGYGSSSYTTIDYRIKKVIEDQSKSFVEKVVKDVKDTTILYMNDQMKSVLGEEIAKNVGIDKVVAKLQSGSK